MVWQKLGSDTLGSAGDTLTVTGFEAKKFMQTLFHTIASGAINVFWQYNNDTGSNYADRWSLNGGSDGTDINQSANWGYQSSSSDDDTFDVNYVCSISGEEKLTITFVVDSGGTGAGNAPNRVELAQKYVPSPDADITEVDVFNTGTGDYDTNSNTSILGTD